MNNEQILTALSKLLPKLDSIGGDISQLRSKIDLPDFNELQSKGETAKLGYAIEDFEIALANIDQEVSDAFVAVEKIKRLLEEKS
jgi:hypothetical protein